MHGMLPSIATSTSTLFERDRLARISAVGAPKSGESCLSFPASHGSLGPGRQSKRPPQALGGARYSLPSMGLSENSTVQGKGGRVNPEYVVFGLVYEKIS